MKKIYLLLIAIAFTTVGFGQAFTGTYNFSSGDPNVSSFSYNGTAIPNLTVSSITKVNVSTSGSAGNFRATTWPTGSTDGGAAGGSVDTSKYFQFTITATGGNTISNPTIDFGVGRSGTGPRRYQWRSSVDNYVSLIPVTTASAGVISTGNVIETPDNTTAYLGNTVTLSSTGQTSITFRFYAYGAEAGTGTGGLQGNLTFNGTLVGGCTQPTTQATSYTTTSITNNSATLNWVRGTGDNVLVLMRQGSAVTSGPSNGTHYTNANPVYGTASAQLGTTGNYIVYNGPASSVNISGLIHNNTYHVAIYEYNNTGFCYKTPALLGNFFIPGIVDCSGAGLNDGFCYGNSQTITKTYSASASGNQLRINFTDGTLETNGAATWDDLKIYDGTNSSGTVLYNSDINGNTINGRTFTATSGNIYLTLVSDSSISCVSGQQTALAYTLTCIPTSCTTPTSVTSLNATPGNQQVALSWINGTCFDEILVVAKANTAVTATPTGDGTTYTASAAFGPPGTEIATGEYVVYKGTGTSVTVTNLTNGTPYHFRVYARKGTTWSAGAAANAILPTVGWQIGDVNQLFTIDFDNTVANVNNGQYTGAGFIPNPSTGQLNSEAWASTGMSDGALPFGGTNTSGDYARGTSAGGVTTGGFYAFTVAAGNRSLGIQPGTADFTPGNVRLKIQNQTGQTVTSVRFQYIIYVRNDQDYSSSFNFSYSYNDIAYGSAPSLDYTSPEAASGPSWIAVPRDLTITGLNIPNGSYVYARWSSDDVSGSGNRDEFGLDDIQVIFDPVPASNNSDIVTTSTFIEPSNVDNLAYTAPSGLTSGNAVKIGEFMIQDGGNTFNDPDLLSTHLTDLSLSVQNFNNLSALAIFDGATNIKEVTSVTATTTFNDFSLTAADNSSKVFSIYATFKPTVTDNEQLRLTISSAVASIAGSGFAASDAGGALTSIDVDRNRIEVTASALSFGQQPTDTSIDITMAPAPTVRAVDVNANLDLDYVTSVSLSTTGTFSGAATTSATPVAGIATFSNLKFSEVGTAFTLTTISGLANATSGTFDVSPVGLQIEAVNQLYTIDFDNTVTNVNNGAYTGSGFTPSPTAGQLNSGAWATTGMSDGALAFGDMGTSGDFARGTSSGGETTEGFYSFIISPGNAAFGIQPGDSDFTPGNVRLKVQNQTGQTVTSVRFQYIIYVRNDQDRSSTLNFSYSYNDAAYGSAPSLNYDSPAAATGTDWIAVPRDLTITGLNIPDGGYVYARWSSNDVAGSGDRDELALDDIQVIFDPVPASENSNIVATPGFDEPDNIDYLSYSATNTLTTDNSIKIGEFSIQDGGDALIDNDNLPTILTDLGFTVQNFNNLAALAIFDGTSNVSEVTTVSGTTLFTDLNLTATDNSNKVFSVYATFKSAVNDNQQIQLGIDSATASITGSGFASSDAGGAQTSIDGDDNRIEVTASQLNFTQQPSNVVVGQAMAPAVTVSAVDTNGNLDVDYTTDVSVNSTGTLSGSPVTVAPSAGVATFNNLVHTAQGTGLTLTVSSGTLTDVVSDPFNVTPGVDYVYSNGWTPGDPSGVSNSSDTILIQSGSTSITAATQAAEVTIDAGTSLTIAAVASMNIANSLTNNGTLTLQSTSTSYSSIVVPSVSGSGTNNYNRHVNVNQASGGNDLISAPFTGQTFGDFAAANTNIVTDPNNANRKLFGPFNKATGTYQIYNVIDDAAVTLDAGIGYRAASTDNGTFTFTGVFNTADVNTAITVGGPQFQIWNLIGNPYSSYIKLADFLAVNASKFHPSRSGVYGYNGTAGGFEIWNSAYSLANPNAIITPGQGFLVASGSPSETVNFTSDMRATGNSDDFIPGRLSTQPIAYLQIGATMASNTYWTDFYFTDLATLGLDPGFDSGVFGTNASSRAVYSQLVQGNQGVDMGIQSIAYSDLGTDVRVPLGINVPQGEQVAVSISASTLPQDVEVYLEDSMANSFTLLNSSSYVFTPNTNLASTGRFFLRFSSSTLSNGSSELDGLQIYAVKRVLHINGLLNAETKVTIHDLQGRAVMTDRLQSGSANNTIDVSSLSSGIYVVKLHNGSQQKNQKIIVK